MAADGLIEIAVEALIEVGSSGPKGCAWAIGIILTIGAGVAIYYTYF